MGMHTGGSGPDFTAQLAEGFDSRHLMPLGLSADGVAEHLTRLKRIAAGGIEIRS